MSALAKLRERRKPRVREQTPEAQAQPKVKAEAPFSQEDLDRWFGSVKAAREYRASRKRTAGWRQRRRKRLLTKLGRRAARGRT